MSEVSMNDSIRNFSLDSFKRANDVMIATNDRAYNNYSRNYIGGTKEYSEEEVLKIIESGSLLEQQRLSRNYFNKDGFYKQIIIHYATVLKYAGLLIPNPSYGKKLDSPKIQKAYYNAVEYVDKMNLPIFFTKCAKTALVDGCYYGIVISADKNSFTVLDLPSGYVCSRFKDQNDNDLIEFDLRYFNTISEEHRGAALKVYPKFIEQEYKKYLKGKLRSSWVAIPADLGICFPFFDGRPFFLSVIPTTIQYDKAVDTERERDLEEIRKIIVQKIPHLPDGRLLFEPEEAEQMHIGAVGMLKSNGNVSVLTTYGDVDAIVSKTSSDAGNTTLEHMLQNVYATAGVSGQIFASTGSSTLESSIKEDISLMMVLGNKFAKFVTNIVNRVYANGNVNFAYQILPVGIHNEQKYVDSVFKLANSGYSLLLPVIALGFSQRQFLNLKTLETDVLKLEEKLIPLSSSYTQSQNGTGQVGRPRKEQEEKSERTIQNETSKDKQTEGGSTD